jgi:RNA polymerase sigma-70 factor (ECF subfamily)
MLSDVPDYNRTRTTMVLGLRDLEDQKVWNRFFESYWKLIYHSARKAGLDDADAQEVVQETVITVTKKIGGFDYDRNKGSFKGWLMQTTKWKIADQFRKINRTKSRESDAMSEIIEELPDELANVDTFWKDNWQKELFDAAIEKTRDEVNPLYFQIYNRLVVKEIKAKDVARELAVPVSQVYLAKHRVTEAIKKSVEEMNDGFQ